MPKKLPTGYKINNGVLTMARDGWGDNFVLAAGLQDDLVSIAREHRAFVLRLNRAQGKKRFDISIK
jgi:hypothetical protein